MAAAGAELAERFDGFLGSGWVRPAVGSSEWHVLYRFADHQALEAWMTSGQRRWWLDSAQGFVDESQLEKRTGIEGWFDEPSGVDVQDLRPAPAAPPRWKQMVSIFLVFLPLSLLVTYLGQEFLADVWMPLRVLVSVLVMTPVMIYARAPVDHPSPARLAARMSGALLIAGTTSDAGKTHRHDGAVPRVRQARLRVAPFKAQNMSNNCMVVGEPVAEIGRAQWVQALAAGVEPEAAMNPVLLKPGGDRRSHVVVMGQPAGEIASSDFIGGRTHLAEAAYAAYDDLASRFDLVVCEGAGSPAEINLRAGDYVNMGLARHAGMPVVVVGDIDRGGVFAAMYGTVALLDAADQRLMAGFVVNKFRGDETLLQPGLDRLEKITGRRVHGVLPWSPDVWLDSEDALDLDSRRSSDEGSLRVAVIRLPRISNFTDVDALGIEPGVDVTFVADPRSLADADLVVLPGTRATLADLTWLRARGPRPGHPRPRGRGSSGARHLRWLPDARPHDQRPGRRRGSAWCGGRGARVARCHDDVRARRRSCGCMSEGGYEIHHGRVDARRRRRVPRRSARRLGLRDHAPREPGVGRVPPRVPRRCRRARGT